MSPFRRYWLAALIVAPLVSAGVGAHAARRAPIDTAAGAPSHAPGAGEEGRTAEKLAPAFQGGASGAWTLLDTDGPPTCAPAEAGREGVAAYWRKDSGNLYLRLCTAAAPGWQSGPSGWSNARYKFRLNGAGGSRLLLLEDLALDRGTGGDGSDGAGEITLLDDVDGSGRFSDDWSSTLPPQYLNNSAGSTVWRRAWSSRTGPDQFSDSGATRDLGFRLTRAACGPAVEMWVDLDLLAAGEGVCASWATDPEARDLDAMPACDTGPGTTCIKLSESPSPTSPPTKTPSPTATPTASSTPTPTDTPEPTATPTEAPPSATVPPTDAPTEAPTETAQAPTSTIAPSTATSTATIPATATASPTVSPSPTEPPPSTSPTATQPATDPPTASATVTSTATSTASATATGGAQISPTPSATPDVGAATPTASRTPSPTPGTGPIPPLPTPPSGSPPPSPSPTAGAGSAPTRTPLPDLGCVTLCALVFLPDGTIEPAPPGTVLHALLLTPWGTPAKPVVTVLAGPDGCALIDGLEPGQYRVWTTLPPGYEPVPGSRTSQVLWIAGGGPCSQAIFRYRPCICPSGGPPPIPPGPPTATPPGGPGIPPMPGSPPPPPVMPPTPSPTPVYPASPDRPAVGAITALPILRYLGWDPVCAPWVEVQNIGDRPAKALMLVWGEPSLCPPQCAGPLKVECSGLLTPGSAWHFTGSQVPAGAKSGIVISANVHEIEVPGYGGDVFADALCEALFTTVVGDCGEYRRFLKAYVERGRWGAFDFGAHACQPMAVEVLRKCPGDLRPDVEVTSSYAGIAGEFLGHYDPVYGGFAYFTPALYAGSAGLSSFIYLQNMGLECTSVELWLRAPDDCLRARICDIMTLAPGETHPFDVSGCMPAGWSGSAWIRSSEPLAVAVDNLGHDVLMTYTGFPSELNYVFNGKAYFTTGSPVAYGPLIYSEYQGWDTAVVVQNLSRVTAAKVKVYFLDRSGGVITTVADWVCAGGAQTFFLPVIADLPGHWLGSVRVESQDWFTPGAPGVSGANIHAIAQLIKYSDAMRTEAMEALAYNLFPEHLAYRWSLGEGRGGTDSGVGRIGIPSFIKDRGRSGITSEISIANVVAKPGFTNFAIYIYDQNGLIDYLCETLSEQQVEYINLASWGFIHSGFKGSAMISATFWEHDVFDHVGGFVRNVVGLAAVKVERSGSTLGSPIPGDEAAGNIGFPVPGPFRFLGPAAPSCPGDPVRRSGSGGGGGGGGPTPPVPPGPPPIRP